MRTCKYCGCTDDEACPGGCLWITDEVCSQCAVRNTEQMIFNASTMLGPLGELMILSPDELASLELAR